MYTEFTIVLGIPDLECLLENCDEREGLDLHKYVFVNRAHFGEWGPLHCLLCKLMMGILLNE